LQHPGIDQRTYRATSGAQPDARSPTKAEEYVRGLRTHPPEANAAERRPLRRLWEADSMGDREMRLYGEHYHYDCTFYKSRSRRNGTGPR